MHRAGLSPRAPRMCLYEPSLCLKVNNFKKRRRNLDGWIFKRHQDKLTQKMFVQNQKTTENNRKLDPEDEMIVFLVTTSSVCQTVSYSAT